MGQGSAEIPELCFFRQYLIHDYLQFQMISIKTILRINFFHLPLEPALYFKVFDKIQLNSLY